VQKTTVALTSQGRAALSAYTQALRDLLGGLDGAGRPAGAARPATQKTAAEEQRIDL
jgi:hypothetical protein